MFLILLLIEHQMSKEYNVVYMLNTFRNALIF